MWCARAKIFAAKLRFRNVRVHVTCTGLTGVRACCSAGPRDPHSVEAVRLADACLHLLSLHTITASPTRCRSEQQFREHGGAPRGRANADHGGTVGWPRRQVHQGEALGVHGLHPDV